MLEGETLDEVKDFRYLGSIVYTHGGTEADVKKRISKARTSSKQGRAGNNWRGLPNTEGAGEMLWMAYAPGGVKGLSDWCNVAVVSCRCTMRCLQLLSESCVDDGEWTTRALDPVTQSSDSTAGIASATSQRLDPLHMFKPFPVKQISPEIHKLQVKYATPYLPAFTFNSSFQVNVTRINLPHECSLNLTKVIGVVPTAMCRRVRSSRMYFVWPTPYLPAFTFNSSFQVNVTRINLPPECSVNLTKVVGVVPTAMCRRVRSSRMSFVWSIVSDSLAVKHPCRSRQKTATMWCKLTYVLLISLVVATLFVDESDAGWWRRRRRSSRRRPSGGSGGGSTGCGNYNPTFNICCAGRLQFKGNNNACCGTRAYSNRFNICCGGTLQFKGNNNACCGTRAYSNRFNICCAGKLQFKGNNNACCGNRAYSNRFYICCAGRLQFKGNNNACCGNRAYSNRFYICCAGRLQFKGNNNACCGTKAYSNSFYVCCNGRLRFGRSCR
ncbi:hypothetical protein LSAT2_010314 [Lamellibrachia satsuma]|nr:hypothetical protein LSAT2_010314 [Lamellibrachia satsuma]